MSADPFAEEPDDYPTFPDYPSDEMVWHRQVEGDLARLTRGAEAALGAVVSVLDSRGKLPLGDMLEVALLSFEHVGWYDDFGERYPEYKARIHVPPQFLDHLDDYDVTDQIRAVLQSMTPERMGITVVSVAPMAAGTDWRSDRALARDDDSLMANQALFPGTTDLIVRDRLRFPNEWEASVYDALKKRQADLPETRTLGIMPGPGFRAPNNTFGPDFVVTYRGRAVAVEVDGPHHARPKRYAADKSKDLVLESCGLVAVLRITPEEVENPELLESFLDAVMEKLGANP